MKTPGLFRVGNNLKLRLNFASRGRLRRNSLPLLGLGEISATGFQLLKSQSDVIGVDGMALFSSASGCRPSGFSALRGFDPAHIPALGFELF